MPKKILFISPANLTVNPRLFKELKLAVSKGYGVDFVGFKLGNWSDKIDTATIKNIDANFHYIPITRKPFINWFLGSVIEIVSKKLYPFFKNNIKLNAYAHSKRSVLLNNYLKKKSEKYDLIISHVLTTLYPAYKFACRTNTPFIFDIEDYHPGEAVSVDAENEKSRREFLMQKILPKASCLTYASPLIGEQSLKLLDNYPKNQHQLINNCFSQMEFRYKENNPGKIKFVWFSQNIAAGRGLELVVPALAKFKDKIELHLIGNLYQDFSNDFLLKYTEIIKIHKPLPQKGLNIKLSEFDIGLAIELNTADFNRQICLTNKIWAYFQSGLYVLATDTLAQAQFIKEHKNAGQLTKQKVADIEASVNYIIKNIGQIRKNKQLRFDYAQKFSWDNESKKLNDIWEGTIS